MYVENLILETDHKLMIYHESLKRLRRHVEIIQQIHIAPAMYLSAVAEVVRRRGFSQAFLMVSSYFTYLSFRIMTQSSLGIDFC